MSRPDPATLPAPTAATAPWIYSAKRAFVAFDSLDAALEEATLPARWRGEKTSRDTLRHAWFGSPSFDAAVSVARHGWPEGRERIVSALDTANLINSPAPTPARMMDVAGAYPDVPAFLSGAPDHMVALGDMSAHVRPIYRFVVSVSASGVVSADAIINRGAAILSYVDKLEAEGAQVEVVTHLGSLAGGKRIDQFVTIKRAGEALEPNRLAFALAHPSMLRRITFALFERIDATRFPGASLFHFGYGDPTDPLPEDIADLRTVVFPCVTSGAPYSDIPSALSEVSARLTTAGMLPQSDDGEA